MRWANFFLFCLDRKRKGKHGIGPLWLETTKGSSGDRIGHATEGKSPVGFLFCHIIIIIVIKYPQLGETKDIITIIYYAFHLDPFSSFKYERSTCWFGWWVSVRLTRAGVSRER